MDRLKTAALAAALAALASPAFAGWTIVKNAPDPFDPAKSTFIAMTGQDREGFGIRCNEGAITLMVVDGAASTATSGEPAIVKIVADGQPPRDEDNAQVVMASVEGTSVQFGDETTLAYLKGAKKISVRYAAGGVRVTKTFGGGKPLDDVIQKALKACGK